MIFMIPFKELLPTEFSWTRQPRQYKHVLSCFPQYRSRFPRGHLLEVLRGIAAGIGISNFLLLFFHKTLEFFNIRSNEEDTSTFSGIIELLVSQDSPLLLCFAVSMHQTHASTHLALHCRVLRPFVSSSVNSPDHENPSGGLSIK